MKTIRILLGDDHTVVRKGLRMLLESQPGFEVIADACDGRETVALAEQHLPDVVVLDVAMPILNGIEAARQISAKSRVNGAWAAVSMVSQLAIVSYIRRP